MAIKKINTGSVKTANFLSILIFVLLSAILVFIILTIGIENIFLNILTLVLFVSIFISIAISLFTKAAETTLESALEYRTVFRDMLDSIEYYFAIINEHNEVVYASKTLSTLGNTEDPEMVRGRPLLDLFPGRTLKLYTGKMLEEKDNYAGDWEFSLDGQKRYFKAASRSLTGQTDRFLISLYDMTYLAERDEIAAMKDAMKIGLFFMDKNYVIQDHYSSYLEELLTEENLSGKLFTDIIADSVSASDLDVVKDYFKMVMDQAYDQDMLDEINPLNEFNYVNNHTGAEKVLQCAFSTMVRGPDIFLLVTIYDITARVKLQQRLDQEKSTHQEEMQSFFEFIQVDPIVFNNFTEDMDYEFEVIRKVLEDSSLLPHDILTKIFQAVHAIKSNAVVLGLNTFGNKVHLLESKIKLLRQVESDLPFSEMLNLTLDIEKLSQDRESFKDIKNKLQTYSGSETAGESRQNVKMLADSLLKTAKGAAEEMDRQVKFEADIDPEVIEKFPRRIIKEILMQFIRNAVVHGIELPKDRTAKGKDPTGIIRLSITITDDRRFINMKVSDDGRGLDYNAIRKKALENNLIREEDADNKDILHKLIFSPDFSTFETGNLYGGRGIGLNLVRDRIKEINGTIKLRSEPDKGTMFIVKIPVQ